DLLNNWPMENNSRIATAHQILIKIMRYYSRRVWCFNKRYRPIRPLDFSRELLLETLENQEYRCLATGVNLRLPGHSRPPALRCPYPVWNGNTPALISAQFAFGSARAR